MDIETAERLVIDSHEEQFDCTDCTTDREILHEVTNTICLPERRCIGAYPLQPTGDDELDTAYRTVLKHWLTDTSMYAPPKTCMSIAEVLDVLNTIPESHRHLPLYVWTGDDNQDVKHISTFDEGAPHSSVNPLSITINN